eukprot:gene12273-23630_t
MAWKACDAVVLGGGVIGCSTAFALAQRGLSVTLIERGTQVASGATSRSSACIRTHYSVEPNSVLANHAVRFFEEFPERLGLEDADCGFEQNGLLLVGNDDGAGGVMAASVERMVTAQGIDTRLVTEAEAKALHPLVETADANVFGWEPKSGYADPYQTTTSFAAAARALGANIELGCAATGLEVTAGEIQGVHTSKGLVAAPIVVSCLNVWSGPLLGKWLGEELPVQAEKHSLISLRANNQQHGANSSSSGKFKQFPMVKCLIQDAQPYFRPTAGGAELLVGDNLPAHRHDEDDPDVWDETVSMDQIIFCAEIAAARFPCYSDAQITSSWCFVGNYHQSVPSTSFPQELNLAPTVGQMLADDAIGAAPFDPDCSIEYYSPLRFAKNQPLTGLYEGAAS